MSRTEYMRSWRAANPTKHREYNKKYREANLDHYKGLINAWFKAHPEKRKDYHLKRAYGISLAEKDEMLAAQGGCCGICKSPEPGTKLGWQVDADHSASPPRVRGILCKNCNTSLGNFRHDAALLINAAQWLDEGFRR